jgi:hypothetical protein
MSAVKLLRPIGRCIGSQLWKKQWSKATIKLLPVLTMN